MRDQDIAEICQLKYRYFRHLDLKEMDQLGEQLTDDCEARYDGGKLSFSGKDAIIEFLTASLGGPSIISEHNGHHPEIVVEDSENATGLWYLEDRVLIAEADLEIGGTAIYEDRYRKVQGEWKIAETGYQRIFEEQRTYSTQLLISMTNRFNP